MSPLGTPRSQNFPLDKNILDCWIFISDKHDQVAQWALVYSFLNVKRSQTQPRDSFQHCSEDFGEFGKVMNGMNVLFSPNEGWMWSPHRETWGWKMGNGELEMGSWAWGIGDGELEGESWKWGIGEFRMENWGWRAGNGELETKNHVWGAGGTGSPQSRPSGSSS